MSQTVDNKLEALINVLYMRKKASARISKLHFLFNRKVKTAVKKVEFVNDMLSFYFSEILTRY